MADWRGFEGFLTTPSGLFMTFPGPQILQAASAMPLFCCERAKNRKAADNWNRILSSVRIEDQEANE